MKVARNVSFGSAVACGKIAILPFKSKSINLQASLSLCGLQYSVSNVLILTRALAVWYMSETASYGVRVLQGLDRREDKSHDQDVEQASSVNNSQVFDEGKVLDLGGVKDINSDDVYVVTVIDAASLDRDDAYTRAITASGMIPVEERQGTTQPRGSDELSLGSRRSDSSAPGGKRE